MNTKNLTGYAAAQQGAAFFTLPGAGYLRVSGEDQASFLQRQTTHDIRLLQPGRALLSVLTSSTARILDVFYLLREPGSIGAITLPGLSERTARFLKSRIFFNDKVVVEDLSDQFAQLDLLSPHASQILAEMGVESVPAANEVIMAQVGSAEVHILATEPSAGMGFRLVTPASAAADVEAAFQGWGAVRLNAETYDILRIEAGLPAAGHELTENYTPLETGLEVAISDSKGCYTGQEIIARQITYDKVTQHLRGLRLESMVKPGERVWGEDKPAGALTSVANSPRFGCIALAVLKRAYNQPGTSLKIGPHSETGISAVVVPLPFQDRE